MKGGDPGNDSRNTLFTLVLLFLVSQNQTQGHTGFLEKEFIDT